MVNRWVSCSTIPKDFQIRFLDLVNIDAVVTDLTILNIKTVDQVRDRGLTGAGGAYECDLLTGFAYISMLCRPRSCHHCNRSPHRRIPLHPVIQYNLQIHPPDVHASMPTYRFYSGTLHDLAVYLLGTDDGHISSSVSTGSSSRSKTLLAPACAITIPVQFCWLTWLIGMLKLALKVKKLANTQRQSCGNHPAPCKLTDDGTYHAAGYSGR